MSVKEYYLSNGDTQLSPNFMLHEFQSGDHVDRILVDPELVSMLEALHERLNCTSMTITSGYRTPSFSVSVGGYSSDKHTLGLAADVICNDVDGIISGKEVCCAAQDLDFNGIGYMGNAVHLDVASRHWWGNEQTGEDNIADFYSYFGIFRGHEQPEDNVGATEINLKEGDLANMDKEQLKYEVNRHALSLLGRAFSDEETETFAVEIVDKGMSWYEFDTQLQESEEGVKYWIRHALFIDILGRVPAQSEVDWWYAQYILHYELNKSVMVEGFKTGYGEFKNIYLQN